MGPGDGVPEAERAETVGEEIVDEEPSLGGAAGKAAAAVGEVEGVDAVVGEAEEAADLLEADVVREEEPGEEGAAEGGRRAGDGGAPGLADGGEGHAVGVEVKVAGDALEEVVGELGPIHSATHLSI